MTVEQQATNSLDADRLAYDLDSCLGLMPVNETCTLDDYHLVMVFNYEPDRLSIAMIQVDEFICNPHKVEDYPQFGEMNASIVSHSLETLFCPFIYSAYKLTIFFVARPSPTAGAEQNARPFSGRSR